MIVRPRRAASLGRAAGRGRTIHRGGNMTDQQRYWKGIRDALLSARHEALQLAVQQGALNKRTTAGYWQRVESELASSYDLLMDAYDHTEWEAVPNLADTVSIVDAWVQGKLAGEG